MSNAPEYAALLFPPPEPAPAAVAGVAAAGRAVPVLKRGLTQLWALVARAGRSLLRILRRAGRRGGVLRHRPVASLLAAGLFLAGLLGAPANGLSNTDGIVLSEAVLASAADKYGPAARSRLEQWQSLLATARGKPEREKLNLVNSFFNRVPFISDPEHWRKNDYWATPSEMLASNGGDCEDFSIAKYFTLLSLGVSMDKLRITYVKTKSWNPVNQAHMVLTYYPTPDAMPLVLDNLIPDIRSAAARTDLTPVYSFNGAGLWLAKERGQGKAVDGGSGRISLWQDLNSRMGREFQ